jgi:hypothetical protein
MARALKQRQQRQPAGATERFAAEVDAVAQAANDRARRLESRDLVMAGGDEGLAQGAHRDERRQLDHRHREHADGQGEVEPGQCRVVGAEAAGRQHRGPDREQRRRDAGDDDWQRSAPRPPALRTLCQRVARAGTATGRVLPRDSLPSDFRRPLSHLPSLRSIPWPLLLSPRRTTLARLPCRASCPPQARRLRAGGP